MSLTTGTLDGLLRKNLYKVFVVESKKTDKQYLDVIGGAVDSTNQLFEQYKSIVGLGPAEQLNEGRSVAYDEEANLLLRSFQPVIFAKGKEQSKQFGFTLQYKNILAVQPAFARAFVKRRNIQGANLDNLGFTDTTMGMNSETLYSTSHSMGNYTFSNMAATSVGLSPKTLEQGLYELRTQRDARNMPMMYTGQVVLKVAPRNEFLSARILKSVTQQGTADHDANIVKERVSMRVIDFYTNAAATSLTQSVCETAWFLRAADRSAHGLFLLEQMPYEVEQLARDDRLFDRWVASESYIFGWFDPHGVWASQGK